MKKRNCVRFEYGRCPEPADLCKHFKHCVISNGEKAVPYGHKPEEWQDEE